MPPFPPFFFFQLVQAHVLPRKDWPARGDGSRARPSWPGYGPEHLVLRLVLKKQMRGVPRALGHESTGRG